MISEARSEASRRNGRRSRGERGAPAPIASLCSPWMMLPSTAPSRPTVTKLAPSRAANAQSGRSMPHLRSHGSEMSGLVPRPQRYGKWLCGGAALKPTVMRAVRSAGLRPCAATALAFLVCPTRTGRQTRRPGGSLGCLATRAGASWSTLAKRTLCVRVGATRRGRTNPTRRSPVCISAKRTQATSATASESRRTNPGPVKPTSISLAKRAQARISPRTLLWPNEPKPGRPIGTVLKPAPTCAQLPSWPNEPEQQRSAVNLLAQPVQGGLASEAGSPGFAGVTRRPLRFSRQLVRRDAFCGEPASPPRPHHAAVALPGIAVNRLL
jgi:hypothetical protein